LGIKALLDTTQEAPESPEWVLKCSEMF